MRQLSLLIQQIRTQLSSDDQTNTEHYKQLADEYVEYCALFKEENKKCKEFLERGMIAECASYAESLNPSLNDLQMMLNFPERKLFIEIFRMYDWPEPEVFEGNALTELCQSIQQTQNLEPLIAEFRKIARTDNHIGKYLILRQLTQQDPGSKEWISLRKNVEKDLFAKFAQEAKTAILAEDYTTLERLSDQLLQTEWMTENNPAVLNKINAVLKEHRQNIAQKNAAKCLEKINDAYSAFDYLTLGEALQQWQELLDQEDFIPSEEISAQVNEARDYFEEQKKNRENDQLIKNLIENLRQGLERNAPLEKMEQIVHMLQVRNADIPELLLRHFAAYRIDVEKIRKRRRIMLGVGCAAIACILIVFIFLGVQHYRMRNAEELWVIKINGKIENNELDEAEKILKKLSESAPELRKQGGIVRLAQVLERKKREKVELHRKFQVIADRIRANLKLAPSRNAQIKEDFTLIKTKDYLSDKELTIIIEDLQKKFEKVEIEFQLKEEGRYREIAKKYRRAEKLFYDALNKKEWKNAEQYLHICENLLRTASTFVGISDQVRATEHLSLEQGTAMREKMVKEKSFAEDKKLLLEQLAEGGELHKISQIAGSLQPYFPESSFPKRLQIQTALYSTFLEHYQKRQIEKFITIKTDVEKLQSLQKRERELMAQLQTTVDYFVKIKPMHSFIIKHEDGSRKGKRYEVFFVKKNRASNPSRDTRGFQIVVSDGDGSAKINGVAQRDPKTGNTTVELELSGRKVTGTLIYPDFFAFLSDQPPVPDEIPYIQEIKALQKTLKTSKQEEVAMKTLAFLERLLHEDFSRLNIHPIIRLNIADILVSKLCESDPQNISYSNIRASLQNMRKEINCHIAFAYINEEERMDALDEGLANIRIDAKSHTAFYKKVLIAALNRRMAICGFFLKNEEVNSTNGFCLFKNNHLEQGELWILDENNSLRKIGKMEKGVAQFSSVYKNKILDGTLVMCQVDGEKTSSERWKELEKEAEQFGIQKLAKPALWPVE